MLTMLDDEFQWETKLWCCEANMMFDYSSDDVASICSEATGFILNLLRTFSAEAT